MTKHAGIMYKAVGRTWWGGIKFHQANETRTIHLIVTPRMFEELGRPEKIWVSVEPYEDHQFTG